MIRNRKTLRTPLAAVGAATLLTAFATVGCGGGGNSNTDSARIRAVNLVPNGGLATVYINSGEANGQQNFEESSTYLYLTSGTSTFTFSLANQSSSYAMPSAQYDLSDNAYTAVVFGNNNDMSGIDTPEVVVLNDNYPSVSSGSAEVRFVNTAPDAGTVNITYDGAPASSNLQYLATASLAAVTSGASSPNTPFSAPYVQVNSGSNNITVTNGSGTLVSQNLTFTSGHAYTVFVVEPNVLNGASAATYGVYQVDDDH